MTRTLELQPSVSTSASSNMILVNGTVGDRMCNKVTSDLINLKEREDQINGTVQCEARRTNQMTNCMDDLSLNSPKERQSRSRSKTCSNKRKSSSRSSDSSSSDSCSSCSSSSSSSSWSRSRSRDRKYRYKRSRRSSRSYSRSHSRSHSRGRSRSYSPRERRRYSPAYRRYYRSPPRYRSRSRSRSYIRSVHRSRYSRSRSRSRGRRYYGFVRRPYSPTFRSWRSRSRTRSRSGTPLRLSEKEKLELLEIAKMNAVKALGKEIELPESLRKDLKKDGRNHEKSRTSAEDIKGNRSDKAYNSEHYSSNGSKCEDNIPGTVKEQSSEAKQKSPYMLWRPVKSEDKSFSNNLSPKATPHSSRSR